jgi:hypothetical protein
MAAFAPRMTTANPFCRESAAGDCAMAANCFNCVLRTSRRETATAGRTKEKNLRGRNRPAIRADGENQHDFWNIQQPTANSQHRTMAGAHHHGMFDVRCSMFDVFHFSSFARFSAARKSFSTSAKVSPAIEFRATKINSTGWASSCWCCRKLSRNKRRARLRCTAPPIFLLVTTPSLDFAPSGNRCQLAMRQPRARRWPCCRMRANSPLCSMRRVRSRRRRLGVSAGAGTRNQTGVRRLRPLRRRLASVALPLLLELRLRNPCWRLRRIFDG